MWYWRSRGRVSSVVSGMVVGYWRLKEAVRLKEVVRLKVVARTVGC
jgi:hypothetical protein